MKKAKKGDFILIENKSDDDDYEIWQIKKIETAVLFEETYYQMECKVIFDNNNKEDKENGIGVDNLYLDEGSNPNYRFKFIHSKREMMTYLL